MYICELLATLATFWLGATRGLLEVFFSGIGVLHKSGFPICELLTKLATFWLGVTRGLYACMDVGSLFSGIGALEKNSFLIHMYVKC